MPPRCLLLSAAVNSIAGQGRTERGWVEGCLDSWKKRLERLPIALALALAKPFSRWPQARRVSLDDASPGRDALDSRLVNRALSLDEEASEQWHVVVVVVVEVGASNLETRKRGERGKRGDACAACFMLPGGSDSSSPSAAQHTPGRGS